MDLKAFFNIGNDLNKTFKHVPTNKFKDENGNAIPWEFKKLSVDEYDALREECTSILGNKGMKFDNTLFNKKFICCSVVEPNLNNAELQDSYGVRKPEDLLTKMFENAGEYYALLEYLLNINGFKSIDEDIEEAKN